MKKDIKLREAFHFSFLERLLKISDGNLTVLKGGVNLRFFLHSPRYSEDMDLDALAGNVSTLTKNGYKILNDASFKRSIRTYGIEDIELNNPVKAKQTEITQRFRVGLITSAGDRLPTKVEFSRRGQQGMPFQTDRIDTEIARQYNKLSYQCQHYPGETAVLQKIQALAGRPMTQARDVFDLAILGNGGYFNTQKLSLRIPKKTLAKAQECLMSLNYEDYAGQVLEYLDDDVVGEYESIMVWEEFKESVLKLLIDGS